MYLFREGVCGTKKAKTLRSPASKVTFTMGRGYIGHITVAGALKYRFQALSQAGVSERPTLSWSYEFRGLTRKCLWDQ